jgi:Protein of unknown function (DUF3106)
VRVKFRTGWVALAALALVLTAAVPSLGQNHPPAKNPPHPAQHPKPQQNNHAGQWLRQHKDMPPEQQKKALENDPQFHNLPPQQKQQLQNQLDRFNNLPPEKRQQMLNRMDTWGHLTPEQKDAARQLHSQMQQLPPERRQAVRNAIQSLRAMPPEARERQIDSDAYKKQFTPQERNILGGASKLPLAPAEPGSPEE